MRSGRLLFHLLLLVLDGNDGDPGAVPAGGGADLRGVGGLTGEFFFIVAYYGLIQVVGDPIQVVMRVG